VALLAALQVRMQGKASTPAAKDLAERLPRLPDWHAAWMGLVAGLVINGLIDYTSTEWLETFQRLAVGQVPGPVC